MNNFRRQAKRHTKAAHYLTRFKARISILLFFVVTLVAYEFVLPRLFDATTFPIRRVKVEGNFQNLDAEQVKKIVSASIHGGFFSVDVQHIRERLMEEPWLAQVSVRRVWPSTLIVGIEEQQEVAYWGSHAMLNADADIFVPEMEGMQLDMAVLHGPVGSEIEVLAKYLTVKGQFAVLGLEVMGVNLSERRAWQILTRDGKKIIVGRQHWHARLARFTNAYRATLSRRWGRIATVDLRYTNGFTVREHKQITERDIVAQTDLGPS